jgi:ubiquitin-protein ligase
LPSHSAWNGVIFVRSGFYRDGKFKFTIRLTSFPLLSPALFFEPTLHHALVNPETGELDVAALLTEPWNYYSQNMLYGLMKDLRRMFTDRRCLACKSSFHPQIARLFESNLHEFIVKAMQSVSESKEQLYVNK